MENKVLERTEADLVVSGAVAGNKSLIILEKDRKGFFFTTGNT